MRLTKDRRVRRRPEYQRVQNVGCRVPTPHFVLIAAPQEDPGASRLGVTASRKVGGAVRRNRLKRLVREAFRAYPEIVPSGHDLVVICRRDDDLGSKDVIREWRANRARLERALRGDSRRRDSRRDPHRPNSAFQGRGRTTGQRRSSDERRSTGGNS